MADETPSSIPDYILKLLLQELEAQNCSREDINLDAILNANEGCFGRRGSKRRRALQYQFSSLKKKSIQQYVAFLNRHSISLGLATADTLLRMQSLYNKNTSQHRSSTTGILATFYSKKRTLRVAVLFLSTLEIEIVDILATSDFLVNSVFELFCLERLVRFPWCL